jgi:hypothetical protein
MDWKNWCPVKSQGWFCLDATIHWEYVGGIQEIPKISFARPDSIQQSAVERM